MAKRRSLTAPSADALKQLEDDFRREGIAPRPSAAPIAQIAAETAAIMDPRLHEQRAAAAQDRVDAEAMREAREKGLILMDLPLEVIELDALARDRMSIASEELEELKSSIARNGLRLPIEVFALAEEGRYGLLSGYRRLVAVRGLSELTGDQKYSQIKAVLRDPEAMGGAFAAMIEENEIRSALSHFERGRIAVVAAQQGAFGNVEAAVEALFPVASKAKRSKIRSFALVFEELGDMLSFPEQLTEKLGLRLAAALREGAEARLRMALAETRPGTAEEEAEAVEAALSSLTSARADPRRGGRPKRQSVPQIRLSSGFALSAREESEGWSIQVGGTRRIDRELIGVLMKELERLLERPE
ncbi:ParB/RepB/Spo0J family partition protein [Pseudogemmobacter faecipullorum]|uniref:ParB N-terminal domain-containing protein n=1 Tax=Pseudogemmobacter faecipullorum TaxID=2755041 RepID=A0ABS8CN37_9RHOB|nr:ParB/RepB/Spo0J family partition protein [Pseudogemmobacter faecipullorum]MCB5410812.1 ParB N-terminal domain-containing protein [Pseudogemmobacter faecipullorum]